MNPKPLQNSKTSVQIEASRAARAFFGDLLEPISKKARASASKKHQDKMWGGTHATRDFILRERVRPSLSILTVMTQTCTTCGNIHTYLTCPEIRFNFDRRHDNYAVETPFAIIAEEFRTLPTSVRMRYETTPICPSCVASAIAAHGVLQDLVQPQRQMDLFI